MRLITLLAFLSLYQIHAFEPDSLTQDVIQKSAQTRLKIQKRYKNKKERIPASIQNDFNNFEKLMNSESDKDWLEEVDNLTK